MKRLIVAAAAIVAVILVLAGCSTGPSTSASKATQTTQATQATSTGRIFTLDALKQYDGQNGNPAYVAVNGIVYDVTNVKEWASGLHNGHKAGTDLTAELAQSPHGDKVLSGLPVVGTLKQ